MTTVKIDVLVYDAPLTADLADIMKKHVQAALAEMYPERRVAGLWVHKGKEGPGDVK